MRVPPLMILVSATAMSATAVTAGEWSTHVTPPRAERPRADAAPPRPSAASKSVAQAQPARHSGRPHATPVAKAPPQPMPQQPLTAQVQFLLRTTLLALNDANRTGNYTVLRDLAAPSFRERNSAADLSHVFAELRRSRLDLSMAAILTPELEEQPSLDAERRLRLKGSYATDPNRIQFEVLYEAVAGHWQLHGIAISTRPSRTAAGGFAPPAR